MKKKKISMAAFAFLIAVGTSIVSKAFTAGWYIPDASDTYAGSTIPEPCNSSLNLCATKYDSNGNVIATAMKDN